MGSGENYAKFQWGKFEEYIFGRPRGIWKDDIKMIIKKYVVRMEFECAISCVEVGFCSSGVK